MTEKTSLTKLQTIKAWKMEMQGMTRLAVALRFNVSERTLSRLYKHYGIPSPKRGQDRFEWGDDEC